MNTYDPADTIRYVHLAVEAATEAAPEAAPGAPTPSCRPLPAGYANRELHHRLTATGRPALVLLPGGAASDDDVPTPVPPTPSAPALRLA